MFMRSLKTIQIVKRSDMDRCSCTMSEVLCGKIYCGYYDIAVKLCEEVPDWDCPEAIEEENEELYDEMYREDETENY
jgi:hypothetical protein